MSFGALKRSFTGYDGGSAELEYARMSMEE
jgi:hypothetical protein